MTVKQRAKRKPIRMFSGGYWVSHARNVSGEITFKYDPILWWSKPK